MKEYILSFGGKFTNTISKNDYLIIGDKIQNWQKAQDLYKSYNWRRVF